MFTARKAVVLLGPPASGKSTVSEELARLPGVEALRIGHLLRREVTRGTATGRQISNALKQGELASTEHVVQVLAAGPRITWIIPRRRKRIVAIHAEPRCYRTDGNGRRALVRRGRELRNSWIRSDSRQSPVLRMG